jgi:DNA topoisomerase II
MSVQIDIGTEQYWILNKAHNTFEKKNLNYSPALLKIFDEILVNAIDRNSPPQKCYEASQRR